MKSILLKLVLLSLMLSVLYSCKKKEQKTGGDTTMTSLPFHSLSLEDLSEFRTAGENWRVAGNIHADIHEELAVEVSDGEGILVNLPDEDHGNPIYTTLEHGDIELILDVLVPKGSNSGLYFQERYEVQILDSWKAGEPAFYDMGGIYERGDNSRPEEDEGYQGSAPLVNASLAPGLWQEFHILFRAPGFDENGNKIRNARFDWIDLNGVRIQQNVELTGPTRGAAYDDEAAQGALMIQGDHGPVAFRNIRYKTYNKTDSLTLGEMEYTVYEYEGDRTPENFENLEIVASGTTSDFNVSEISPKNEHYAILFSGSLNVPVSGEYFFQTSISNGGNLYINGDLLVENTGEFEGYRPGNRIYLEEGSHQLEVSYFQIIWGTQLAISYEGPGMEKRSLIFDGRSSESRSSPGLYVMADPDADFAELIGGFVNYGGEKRTHTLSVGNPEGVHYSYDLNRGMLLTFWRNPFADVTQMWQGRGHEQLLVPMNAAVEESAGIPLADLGPDGLFENETIVYDAGVSEYQLDDRGRPTFILNHPGIQVTDKIEPSESGEELIRTLSFRSEEPSGSKAARIARGNRIERVHGGLYRVDGRYYLKILNSDGEDPEILENNDLQTLLIPILRNGTQSAVQYELIW